MVIVDQRQLKRAQMNILIENRSPILILQTYFHVSLKELMETDLIRRRCLKESLV